MSDVRETCGCGAEWEGSGTRHGERAAFREAHAVCRLGTHGAYEHPEVLDCEGHPLKVGDRVIVDGCDESRIVGWNLGYGDSLRVAHAWLTGYHPDEPNPSEQTVQVDGNTCCPNLRLADSDAKGAENG